MQSNFNNIYIFQNPFKKNKKKMQQLQKYYHNIYMREFNIQKWQYRKYFHHDKANCIEEYNPRSAALYFSFYFLFPLYLLCIFFCVLYYKSCEIYTANCLCIYLLYHRSLACLRLRGKTITTRILEK